jgi:diadenosine tetraphosphatase ApaH/serine/threonine PP2A family protein phosphatase
LDREVVEAAQSEETAVEQDDIDGQRTQFAAERLDTHALSFLGELPLTQVLELEGFGTTLFCHATPRRDDETFTERSPHERIAEILADVGESVIVCGHTHMQFDLFLAGRRIINAGSVGQPYEGHAGAYWVLLGEGSLELPRTAYDYAKARKVIEESGFPFADAHVADLFDAPPSREIALSVFEPTSTGVSREE